MHVHSRTGGTGEPVAGGSFLSEWVRGSLGTSVLDPRGSTHWGVALKQKGCPKFAFMSTRGVFFLSPFIYSNLMCVSLFWLTPPL